MSKACEDSWIKLVACGPPELFVTKNTNMCKDIVPHSSRCRTGLTLLRCIHQILWYLTKKLPHSPWPVQTYCLYHLVCYDMNYIQIHVIHTYNFSWISMNLKTLYLLDYCTVRHLFSSGRFVIDGASSLSSSETNPPMGSRHWCWWWLMTLLGLAGGWGPGNEDSVGGVTGRATGGN